MKWQDYIEERKDVMMGKPVLKGTRLTVEHILKELGTGMSQRSCWQTTRRSNPSISRLSCSMRPRSSRWTRAFTISGASIKAPTRTTRE